MQKLLLPIQGDIRKNRGNSLSENIFCTMLGGENELYTCKLCLKKIHAEACKEIQGTTPTQGPLFSLGSMGKAIEP